MIALSMRIPKYNFFHGGPNFGGGTARKFTENGQIKGHILSCKSDGGQFRKRVSAPTPGTKIFVMHQFSYIKDQFLGKNEKKTKFLGQNLTLL